MTAPAMRILGDRYRFGKDALAELVLQKAGAASNRRSRNCSEQMRDETASHPRVEYDRTFACRHFASAEPLDRSFAGTPAEFARIPQIGRIYRVCEIVI